MSLFFVPGGGHPDHLIFCSRELIVSTSVRILVSLSFTSALITSVNFVVLIFATIPSLSMTVVEFPIAAST